MNNIKTPDKNCSICPRLKAFIDENRIKFPDFFNAPVPSFGDINAQLLIVGLAPGLKGANKTGRPFTGDYAGLFLYDCLKKFNFSKGEYKASINDNVELINSRITNAVRCVPPKNKPTGQEEKNCRPFLVDELNQMKNLKVILCLGTVAHKNIISTLGAKQKDHKFGHGNVHKIDKYTVVDTYHSSRYNVNTGRLTIEMFEDVFRKISQII